MTWRLACALARQQIGKILVVDGDLRNPTLSYRLGLYETGLADAALGKELQPTPHPLSEGTLFGLGAGRIDKDVTENLHAIFASGKLFECLAEFDLVLVDTPPISVCDDSVLFGEICDGVILIISAAKYRGGSHLQQERFKEFGVPVLGGIITHAGSRQRPIWRAALAWLGLLA